MRTLVADRTLHVENIKASYAGALAINGITLDVAPGEVVALLGANGAGKSTTLRAISGLHRIDKGSVTFAGQELRGRSANKVALTGLAHVPEGRRLFGRMTVRENLEIGLYRRWPAKASDVDRAFEMFPELKKHARSLCFSLSGGEQQMVTIARALLPDPDIVMLDEPSLGLAPVVVDRIIDTVHRLRDEGKGVLLVEQDTEVALSCSDRGYVLANGRVVISGTSDELRASDEMVEAYIGR